MAVTLGALVVGLDLACFLVIAEVVSLVISVALAVAVLRRTGRLSAWRGAELLATGLLILAAAIALDGRASVLVNAAVVLSTMAFGVMLGLERV